MLNSSSIPDCVPVKDTSYRNLYSSTPLNFSSSRRKSSCSTASTVSTEQSLNHQGSKESKPKIPSALLRCIPIQATGYTQSLAREILYWLIAVSSLGLSLLLSSWFSIAALKLRRRRRPIDRSTAILVKTMSGSEIEVALVKRRVELRDLRLVLGEVNENDCATGESPVEGSPNSNVPIDVLMFEFLCQHFIFDPWQIQFVNIQFPVEDVPFSQIWQQHGNGLQDLASIQSRRHLFGECLVNVPLKTSFELIVTECVHPFYVFQLASLILWFCDDYYYYASAVLILSCISLFISTRETLRNNRNLHKMARFCCSVRILRKHPLRSIKMLSPNLTVDCLRIHSSTELVPGDIFAVERGMKLPCDGILLTGNALIDESMMTGETKPVYKTALPSEDSPDYLQFRFSRDHKHVIYGGSEARHAGNASGPALCLVVRTGFSSEQGRMMKSLVHPVDSTQMNFEKEIWKFVGLLALMSMFTFGLTLYEGIMNSLNPITIFKRSVDTITIAVPPALPIIISVGILCAQDALKKNSGTTCLTPSRINVAGRANVIVFDKTGTLTEDDEDLVAVVPSKTFINRTTSESSLTGAHPTLLQPRFPRGIPLNSNLANSDDDDDDIGVSQSGLPQDQKLPLDLVVGLATCHSLGFVDNELIGDPLEFQMFNFTGWKFRPPKPQVSCHFDDSKSDGKNEEERTDNDRIDHVGLTVLPQIEADLLSSDLLSSDIPSSHLLSSHLSSSDLLSCSSDNWADNYLSVYPVQKGDDASPTAWLKLDDDDDDENGLNSSSNSTRAGDTNRHHQTDDDETPAAAIRDDDRSLISNDQFSSSFLLKPSSINDNSYSILRVFEFDPCLQRMSVIVGNKHAGIFKIYSKGSPEKIKSLCNPNSIHSDYDKEFSSYAERGLRVLAIAQNTIENNSAELPHIKRQDVEQNLTFLGFLLFSNLLRPDSAEAIQNLQSAGCCVYMATGDGPVTSAAVGYQVGILPSEVEVLISGVLQDGSLKWKMKPFGTSSSSTQHETHCVSSNSSTYSGSSGNSFIKETNSLLRLVQGRCLSKVGISVTGEAFRHIVMMAETEVDHRDLSPLSLDRFEVDAFSIEKRKFNTSCFPCKKADNRKAFQGCRIWDGKPRSMGTLEFVLRYVQIFSRMSPDDKALLIQQLQSLSNAPIVSMCGDGANDCAALKASDVGISLSAKEASVAAPFNCSKRKSIHVVIDVLREGRGALANSIQNFQYVALYAMIQLCSVTVLSHYGASLADAQFLYLDLGLVLPLSYFMSWSRSSSKLASVLPPQSLLAWSIVVSLVGQVVIQTLFQLAAVFVVLPFAGASFYVPFEVDVEDETNFFGYENSVIFLVSNIQTVVSALILVSGTRPWKVVQGSKCFLFVWAFLSIIGFALVLNEAPYMMWLRRLLSITSFPLTFRTILLLTVSIYILASFVLEQGIVRKILRRIEANQDSKKLNRESLRSPGVDEMVLKSTCVLKQSPEYPSIE